MGRIGFYPNFGFPCDVFDMPFEFSKIRKSTDINFSCFALSKSLLQFNLPLRGKWTVRCNRFYQEKEERCLMISASIPSWEPIISSRLAGRSFALDTTSPIFFMTERSGKGTFLISVAFTWV